MFESGKAKQSGNFDQPPSADTMTFTNILKALGLSNNSPPAEPSHNPTITRGTPGPATSKAYPGYAPPPPNIVDGYPVNDNCAPPVPALAPAYCYPTQPAPSNPSALNHNNVTSFVPHDDSEGLNFKPPHVYNNSSIAGPDQPANSKSSIGYANPQLPKNNGKGDKNIGGKNGKKKSGTSRGDSFKVHGNTITGGKGDKVGVFDFGNKYSRGRKKRDKEDSTEEDSDTDTEDERD